MTTLTWFNKAGDETQSEDNLKNNNAMQRAGFSKTRPSEKSIKEFLAMKHPEEVEETEEDESVDPAPTEVDD